MINSNVTDIPWISQGEILAVEEPRSGDIDWITYKIETWLRNGNRIVLRYVPEMTSYGGISDYHRHVSMARDDAEGMKPNSVEANVVEASVGCRVYITFINGSINSPVIIGYRQHPNQVKEKLSNDKSPKALVDVKQFFGVREETQRDGSYRFIRKGAPEVKHSPAGVIPSTSLGAKPGDDSTALTPKDSSERFVVEFLDKGLMRMRDPKGGMIEFNHAGDKKGVYISDNDWTADEDPDISSAPMSGGLQAGSNSTDSEYIWLNREKKLLLINARETLQLYSFNKRKDVTDGEYISDIKGNNTWTVGGDAKTSAAGEFRADASGGSFLSLKNGKVSLGNSSAELVDVLLNVISEMISGAAQLVATPAGAGILNPSILKSLTDAQIKLTTLKK